MEKRTASVGLPSHISIESSEENCSSDSDETACSHISISSDEPVESKNSMASEGPVDSQNSMASEDPTDSQNSMASEYPVNSRSSMVSEDPVDSHNSMALEDPTDSLNSMASEDPTDSQNSMVSEEPTDSQNSMASEDPTDSLNSIESEGSQNSSTRRRFYGPLYPRDRYDSDETEDSDKSYVSDEAVYSPNSVTSNELTGSTATDEPVDSVSSCAEQNKITSDKRVDPYKSMASDEPVDLHSLIECEDIKAKNENVEVNSNDSINCPTLSRSDRTINISSEGSSIVSVDSGSRITSASSSSEIGSNSINNGFITSAGSNSDVVSVSDCEDSSALPQLSRFEISSLSSNEDHPSLHSSKSAVDCISALKKLSPVPSLSDVASLDLTLQSSSHSSMSVSDLDSELSDVLTKHSILEEVIDVEESTTSDDSDDVSSTTQWLDSQMRAKTTLSSDEASLISVGKMKSALVTSTPADHDFPTLNISSFMLTDDTLELRPMDSDSVDSTVIKLANLTIDTPSFPVLTADDTGSVKESLKSTIVVKDATCPVSTKKSSGKLSSTIEFHLVAPKETVQSLVATVSESVKSAVVEESKTLLKPNELEGAEGVSIAEDEENEEALQTTPVESSSSDGSNITVIDRSEYTSSSSALESSQSASESDISNANALEASQTPTEANASNLNGLEASQSPAVVNGLNALEASQEPSEAANALKASQGQSDSNELEALQPPLVVVNVSTSNVLKPSQGPSEATISNSNVLVASQAPSEASVSTNNSPKATQGPSEANMSNFDALEASKPPSVVVDVLTSNVLKPSQGPSEAIISNSNVLEASQAPSEASVSTNNSPRATQEPSEANILNINALEASKPPAVAVNVSTSNILKPSQVPSEATISSSNVLVASQAPSEATISSSNVLVASQAPSEVSVSTNNSAKATQEPSEANILNINALESSKPPAVAVNVSISNVLKPSQGPSEAIISNSNVLVASQAPSESSVSTNNSPKATQEPSEANILNFNALEASQPPAVAVNVSTSNVLKPSQGPTEAIISNSNVLVASQAPSEASVSTNNSPRATQEPSEANILNFNALEASQLPAVVVNVSTSNVLKPSQGPTEATISNSNVMVASQAPSEANFLTANTLQASQGPSEAIISNSNALEASKPSVVNLSICKPVEVLQAASEANVSISNTLTASQANISNNALLASQDQETSNCKAPETSQVPTEADISKTNSPTASQSPSNVAISNSNALETSSARSTALVEDVVSQPIDVLLVNKNGDPCDSSTQLRVPSSEEPLAVLKEADIVAAKGAAVSGGSNSSLENAPVQTMTEITECPSQSVEVLSEPDISTTCLISNESGVSSSQSYMPFRQECVKDSVSNDNNGPIIDLDDSISPDCNTTVIEKTIDNPFSGLKFNELQSVQAPILVEVKVSSMDSVIPIPAKEDTYKTSEDGGIFFAKSFVRTTSKSDRTKRPHATNNSAEEEEDRAILKDPKKMRHSTTRSPLKELNVSYTNVSNAESPVAAETLYTKEDAKENQDTLPQDDFDSQKCSTPKQNQQTRKSVLKLFDPLYTESPIKNSADNNIIEEQLEVEVIPTAVETLSNNDAILVAFDTPKSTPKKELKILEKETVTSAIQNPTGTIIEEKQEVVVIPTPVKSLSNNDAILVAFETPKRIVEKELKTFDKDTVAYPIQQGVAAAHPIKSHVNDDEILVLLDTPIKAPGKGPKKDDKENLTEKTAKQSLEEAKMEQECGEMKLAVNQLQQIRATLELQLRQKEEIIIKTEVESHKKEASYKIEIEGLKEKIKENNDKNFDEDVKLLKEQIELYKAREEKLNATLSKLVDKEGGFKQIMDEYETTLSSKVCETEKLKGEHDTAKRHLANLELAFSDIHQKYERSKNIIEGYKNNEEALRHSLCISNEVAKKNEEKYDSLKAHAKAQIEKCNKELNSAKEKHHSEVHKLTAIVRRLEIKNGSLATALEQKSKEYEALETLCDEMTGGTVH